VLLAIGWWASSALGQGSWVGYDADVPSPEATGAADGTLAVRVWSDGTGRYAEGAPAVVFVRGGTSQGSLAQEIPQAAGAVVVVFLFPGGVDVASGRASDGVYDFRGPASIAALRDVALFAAGALASTAGQSIGELIDGPVLADGAGLLGSSNGGNAVLAVAAAHGEALRDRVRWILQWESPVSSQAAVGDNRGPRTDCPGGAGGLGTGSPGFNPRYVSYGALALDIDYSDVAYRPAEPTYRLFLDGNGDGVYSTVAAPGAPGCVTNDLDLDGTLELDEDYPLSAYPDAGGVQVYSRSLTEYLDTHPGVFGGPWPAAIATAPHAAAYWDEREAVRLYEAARAGMPQLFGLVIASTADHVQTDPGYFHVRQAFDGWQRAGAWARINASPGYVLALSPGATGLPANPPNLPPAEWSDPSFTMPESVSSGISQAAAIHQLADRARAVLAVDAFESGDLIGWSQAVP
jgi:hypothetical protein